MSNNETFNFQTALTHLQNGRILKRSCWTFASHIRLSPCRTMLLDEYSDFFSEEQQYFLSYEDIVATDWQIYTEYENAQKN